MEPLFERETEFAVLGAGLEQAREGRGGVVVVEGSPGSGKTALLRAFRETAQGVRVLQATGGELEREFPFGVVRQLFERAVLAAPAEQRERWLAGAAALAAPVIGAAPDLAEPVADASFATLHGLYWLAATLADEAPLLLLVDDAHWADSPSLRFLDFLGRRAQELPLLVVIGTRVNEPGADAELLDALAADAAIVRPRPLGADSVRALIGGDDDAVASALDATRGNPLLVRELVRALGDAPATAEAVSAAVPSSLTRSVQRRLARVGERARTVARALAVLGRDAATLAAVTGLTTEQVVEALAALRAIDLIEDEPPAFIHPLLRAAAAESVTASERDLLHHRAAEHLRTRPGAEEEVIVHLLAAPPLGQPWAADALREAARRALGEGVPDAALRRLRRALEEVEPSREERFVYELELGRAAVRAGDPLAAEHLAAASAADDPGIAAQAVVELIAGGQFLGEDLTHGIARLREAYARLGTDRELRDRLGGQIINAMVHETSLAAERGETLQELAVDPGPAINAHLAYSAASADGTAQETLTFAHRALGDRPFTRLATIEHPTAFWAVVAVIAVDGDELARSAIADAEVTVQRHRTRLGSTFIAFMRAEWLLAFGSAALAEADAREALDLWGSLPQNIVAVGARASLVRALVLRGELEAADRELAAFPPGAFEDTLWGGVLGLNARGELRSAQARHAEAIADHEAVHARLDILGWRRMALGHEASRHARDLIAAGRVEEGRALAEAEHADAVRRGVASYEAAALIALAAAHAATAAPRGDAIATLELAVAAAERSPSLRLRAEAHVELGSALRRAGRRTDARPALALARDLATRIDARSLADRAVQELVIAGGRPRRVAQEGVGALTPSERRTAEHAARGLSNREIAETLYVTRKTVEFTLGNVYSKLGIRSRGELPAALGA